jgi:hypothetical protein
MGQAQPLCPPPQAPQTGDAPTTWGSKEKTSVGSAVAPDVRLVALERTLAALEQVLLVVLLSREELRCGCDLCHCVHRQQGRKGRAWVHHRTAPYPMRATHGTAQQHTWRTYARTQASLLCLQARFRGITLGVAVGEDGRTVLCAHVCKSKDSASRARGVDVCAHRHTSIAPMKAPRMLTD